MRRPHDRADLLEPDPDGSTPGGGPAAPVQGDPDLVAALERCAAGDRDGADALRAWQGGRLHDVLLRILGDSSLADRVLDAVLDDLFRNAAMISALGRGPVEDRVFGLLRRHAYAALRQGGGGVSAPPRPVPSLRPAPDPVVAAPPPPRSPPLPPPSPPPPSAPVTAAPPSPPPSPPTPSPLPEPVAGPIAPRAGLTAAGVVTPLEPEPTLRRPGGAADEIAPVHFDDEDDDEWEAEPPRWRGWARVVSAWLAACVLGFAVAYLVSLVLDRQAEFFEPEEVAPPLSSSPPPVLAPARPVEPAAPPEPSSREILGEPLEAPEPPPVTVPPPSEPAAAAPQPEQPAAPTVASPPPPSPQAAVPVPPTAGGAASAAPLSPQARVFIHHSANDRAAAARAAALASELQEQGASVVAVRSVPFGIRGLSVRYFHPGDRAPAAQVLDLTKGALAETAAASAPSSPSDFTSFSPAPRLGTIEVWLPGG